MKRKKQFLKAVQILAPGDRFILKAAQRVPEESLPLAPGGAALELVVALQKLAPSAGFASSRQHAQIPERQKPQGQKPGGLSLRHALRIKTAQHWLRLGEADQAWQELEALLAGDWSQPPAVNERMALLGARGERDEATVQE